MSVGERRCWEGFESRPVSTRGPSAWSSEGRIWAVSRPSGEPPIRSDPCTAKVSAISRGFESRPFRSTRCGNHNVSPGQSPYLVAGAEPTSSRSFKPSRWYLSTGGPSGTACATLRATGRVSFVSGCGVEELCEPHQ